MAIKVRVREKDKIVATATVPPPKKTPWNGDPWQLFAAELLSK